MYANLRQNWKSLHRHRCILSFDPGTHAPQEARDNQNLLLTSSVGYPPEARKVPGDFWDRYGFSARLQHLKTTP